ncbi:MAG: transcriptional regulator [Polyangiaceae bacterium]
MTRETWRRAPIVRSGERPDLTPEEQAHIRAALRVLRQRLGGYVPLAAALGVNAKSLKDAGAPSGKPGVGLALRASRLAGVPMEDVLSGSWPRPGSCPHCGRI